jgi:hypothetical protein
MLLVSIISLKGFGFLFGVDVPIPRAIASKFNLYLEVAL